MRTFREDEKPQLLIIASKKFRQAGITHLLEVWSDAMGLSVQAVAPDIALEKCAPKHCEMIIVSAGSASVDELQDHISGARRLMPQTPLVIISDREDTDEVLAAFDQGAVGFMPTSTEPAIAFQALSFIKSGGSYFPPSILSNCTRKIVSGEVSSSDLTPKQEEVFSQIRKGHSNKIIARQLGMSEATVKVHVHSIMHKFGVANRTQLAVAALNDERSRMALDDEVVEPRASLSVNLHTSKPVIWNGRR